MSSKVERLGRSELGRHAFETHMPEPIWDVISKKDDSNNTYNVIPALAKLLEGSRDLETAYLCNPNAVQVSKIPKEGGHFCGYRNIQMLWLSLHPSFEMIVPSEKLPVPRIQDMIELAWDAGINAHGRVQTGGIKGTRKHIGTSEAEAILLHHSVPCTGKAFQGSKAWLQLLDYVEAHFASSYTSSKESNIKQTTLPPIFLQRPNHSLSIIGIERTKSGKRRLLVFDPAWRPPKHISQPPSSTFCSTWSRHWTLKRYRKEESYLKRFKAFETLVVDTPF